MQRDFSCSLDLGDGQRLTLRDPDWLKRPLVLAWVWASSVQFLRSVVRIARQIGMPAERVTMWLARSLVVWPAVKTFLVIGPEERGQGERGDVFYDRGYRSVDVTTVAAQDLEAVEREKEDLLQAVPSSPRHGGRQDLAAPSTTVTDRELRMVWAAMSIVEEYGAPNPVKIRPHCRKDQFAGVLLSAVAAPLSTMLTNDDDDDDDDDKKMEARAQAATATTTGVRRAGLSGPQAWRCLFARTVDAVFLKACLEEGVRLVPIDVREFDLFFDLFCDKNGIVLVADDVGDARLLSELDATASSTFSFPPHAPEADWGGRIEPCREKITVGFRLWVGDAATRRSDRAKAGSEQNGATERQRKDEEDRLFEEQVMMDQD